MRLVFDHSFDLSRVHRFPEMMWRHFMHVSRTVFRDSVGLRKVQLTGPRHTEIYRRGDLIHCLIWADCEPIDQA